MHRVFIDDAFGDTHDDHAATPTEQAFREAMSRVPGAVHVVTTAGPAGRMGFTATSVAPVSDAPPTVLVCLNRASQVLPVLEANGVFCVNTLAGGEGPLADVFAGRTGLFGAERFRSGGWTRLETGAPALVTARAAMDCRLTETIDAATHRILIGEVRALAIGAEGDSLVYKGRRYHAL
ncbi:MULTISPECIES: flavin reductase [Chelatococcus]|uniref:Flavin reductase n=1 Tax=Chelatococcus caeni TaxID=1348468 RepID=A0A840BYY4_9HYPH|nr:MULTISPECIES: flavin reductase [Chelatococcus]ALA16245.1 4-hydroxyphenylacetate 3-monooxygenase [Chelatococcus sp. CO-6]MBB4017773.1 flavin reductase [Chelatococcus caeni]